jgi:hypothetical protein
LNGQLISILPQAYNVPVLLQLNLHLLPYLILQSLDSDGILGESHSKLVELIEVDNLVDFFIEQLGLFVDFFLNFIFFFPEKLLSLCVGVIFGRLTGLDNHFRDQCDI